MLLGYRKISHSEPLNKLNIEQDNHGSKRCNSCGLCGKFGKLRNMVIESKELKTKNGIVVKPRRTLTCKNYGIYLAECKFCKETYIGQTKNKFSVRWNAHRDKWRKLCSLNAHKDNNISDLHSDEASLYRHFTK